MDNLKEIVRNVVEGYTGKAFNGHLYLTVSPDEDVFTVVGIGVIKEQRIVNTALIVHIVSNFVIVERDQTDKIVLDALLEAGIPRSQIILAYAGEPIPEAA